MANAHLPPFRTATEDEGQHPLFPEQPPAQDLPRVLILEGTHPVDETFTLLRDHMAQGYSLDIKLMTPAPGQCQVIGLAVLPEGLTTS